MERVQYALNILVVSDEIYFDLGGVPEYSFIYNICVYIYIYIYIFTATTGSELNESPSIGFVVSALQYTDHQSSDMQVFVISGYTKRPGSN